MSEVIQQKQKEWFDQWTLFQDREEFLFQEWIHPFTMEDFRDKEVLEAGCGGGQHTAFMAKYAKKITAVDLNTITIAKERCESHVNIDFVEADIATMDLAKQYDVVLSIGVVHHTDDPDKTMANLIKHVRPGGKLVVWVYSKEGNFLIEYGVELLRQVLIKRLSRRWMYRLSQCITAAMIIPIYTVYRLPLRFLPFYEYFGNFRKLSFNRNVLNVFAKLNAPQVHFITQKQAHGWVEKKFEDIHISQYCGVSWRVSGKIK